ncbi:hypothetical protein [Aquimarina longa]|uniref:hypothetical protein n=1 Tax=Aquimarina longa TaxID=1080221 RepID=UPI0007818D1F|nr:hypothetical protein [Aquimarina longa]
MNINFIKKTKLLSPIILTLLLAGCNNDDDTSLKESNNIDSNPKEEVLLDINTVSKNIIINGSKKISSTAPSPKGTLPFKLDYSNQSAFMNSGFQIPLDIPSNYKGAYVQITSKKGDPASEYFDIPNTHNNFSSNNFANKTTEEDKNEYTIIINFGSKITAGKFCYTICIYDDQGNISKPTQICVEVEDWGGNTTFVGTWNYQKQIENSLTTTYIEKENCENRKRTIKCSNQETITINNDNCNTINSFSITANADGTYEYTREDTFRQVNNYTTQANCDIVFTDSHKSKYTSKGNWAYDEEEKILTMVEFKSIHDRRNGDVTERTNLNGELVFNGVATISNSKFSIIEDYTIDEIPEIVNFFFSK